MRMNLLRVSAVWRWVAVLGVLVLGAALRLYQLGAESLWTDELESWKQASYPTLGEVITLSAVDIHPPGYRVLLYIVENTLGDSELALRWASAVGGVLALAAIFALGRTLYSARVGLIAAALLAVTWPAIHYSREGRAYSLLLAFAILTTWFWLRLLKAWWAKQPPQLALLIAYALTALAMAYLHYFGLYLLLWQGLGAGLMLVAHSLVNKHSERTAWLTFSLLYLAIVLGYAPWGPTLWQHFTQGPIWIPPPGEFGPTLLSFLDWAWGRAEWLRWGALALLALGAMVGLGLTVARWAGAGPSTSSGRIFWRWAFSPSLFLALWFTLPFVAVYLKSTYSASVLTPRNLIILLPPLYLLLARAISLITELIPAHVGPVIASERPEPVAGLRAVSAATQSPAWTKYHPLTNALRWAVGAALTLLCLGAGLYQLLGPLQYYTTPQKGLFRDAVRYIADHEAQYPNALIIGYSWDTAYIDYYLRRLGSPRRVQVIAGNRPEIPAVEAALSVAQPRYVWYIRAFRNPESEFLDFLHQHLTQIEYRQFPGPDPWLNTEVWVFERK